jgi:hypothetical protein
VPPAAYKVAAQAALQAGCTTGWVQPPGRGDAEQTGSYTGCPVADIG